MLPVSRSLARCWRSILYCSCPLSGRSMPLYARSKASVGRTMLAVHGWWFHGWRFGHLLMLVAPAWMSFQRGWAGTIEQFYPLCNWNNHIRLYGTSSADSIDWDRSFGRPELESLPYALSILTSHPTSLCLLVCFTRLEEINELMLLRLLVS